MGFGVVAVRGWCKVGVIIVVMIVGAATGGALVEAAIVVSAGGLVVPVVGRAWATDRAG